MGHGRARRALPRQADEYPHRAEARPCCSTTFPPRLPGSRSGDRRRPGARDARGRQAHTRRRGTGRLRADARRGAVALRWARGDRLVGTTWRSPCPRSAGSMPSSPRWRFTISRTSASGPYSARCWICSGRGAYSPISSTSPRPPSASMPRSSRRSASRPSTRIPPTGRLTSRPARLAARARVRRRRLPLEVARDGGADRREAGRRSSLAQRSSAARQAGGISSYCGASSPIWCQLALYATCWWKLGSSSSSCIRPAATK